VTWFAVPTYLAILVWLAVIVTSRRSPKSRPACGKALRWGWRLGGLAFLAGYLLPLVTSPESNQGPLLGIFVTGPLGFVGGVVAALYALDEASPGDDSER